MSKLSPRQAFVTNVVFAFIGMGLGHFVGGMLWEMKKAEGKWKAARRSRSGVRC